MLDDGGKIAQETRGFDADAGVTVPQRGKEEAHDYRYFPEPDLGPLVLEAGLVDRLRAGLGELPWIRRQRFIDAHGLTPDEADVVAGDKALAAYFEATAEACGDSKAAAHWVQGEVLGRLNRDGLAVTQSPVSPAQLGGLLRLLAAGTVGGRAAKEVLDALWTDGGDAEAIVKARGLTQVRDVGAIEAVVDAVLAESPEQVEAYRAGKTKLLGYLVGQVMKKSRGRAEPQVVNDLLREKLGG